VRHSLTYSCGTEAAQKPAIARLAARLRVLKGRADPAVLAIRSDRINIGRLREVISTDGGSLTRRNDLAFDDKETTVGRYQASIAWNQVTGNFRIYDGPNSQFKTRIMREGRIIECDSTRGVQLRSGDELIMGEVRISFELEPQDSETRPAMTT
jgi:hypothetical protein